MTLVEIGERFAREVGQLQGSGSTTEETYYPALRELCAALLEARRLPFQVRVNTSEQRGDAGGVNRPDLALYDRNDAPAVFGEVKKPGVDITDLACSVDRDDQVGRYLSETGVVLLFTVRSIALLACRPGITRKAGTPVAVADRDVLGIVDFWPSETALRKGAGIDAGSLNDAADLIERAVTEFAPIATPEALALILARLARRARAALPPRFETVQSLLEDYRSALGLSFTEAAGEEFFRSSLIQTAFYALFAGWTLWHRKNDGRPFNWEQLEEYLKIPFLGKLFYEFRHPDRLHELGLAGHLDRASEALGRVDRPAFFAAFTYGGWREPDGDASAPATAITYFYEPFLEAFDPDLRKEMGVWYTPPEIVRYQVRRAHHLLKTALSCPRGFADEKVVVLDPCCGTGAYLLEVISCIAEDLLARGDDALLAAELLQAMTERVVGFEILTAPFVIAQLQIYLLLADLGVPPGPSDRPAVFLTNALTGWDEPEQIRLNFPELAQEHEAARAVKREASILVVLGNPPYNRFAGTALDEEADLVDHYKGITRAPRRDRQGNVITGRDGRPVLVQQGESALYTTWGVRKQLLDDLYIRFFRLAERRIAEVGGRGIVSFISNSSFLTGRSHPMMRESLLRNFDEVWVDNMHGNRLASERTPWGDSCETLFSATGSAGIRVGTAITTFLRNSSPIGRELPRVWYRDFWGKAHAKRHALLRSLITYAGTPDLVQPDRPEGPRAYEQIHPTAASRWMLCPRDENVGFESWPSVDELFPVKFHGVNANRGLIGSVVDTDRDQLAGRMRKYFESERFDEIAELFPELARPRSGYDPRHVHDELRRLTRFQAERIVPYVMFPLDRWWLYYETESKLFDRRSPEFWDNLHQNEFLITVPQPRRASESLPLISQTLVSLHVHDRGSVCFPATVKGQGSLLSHAGPNLAHDALAAFQRLGLLAQDDDGAAFVSSLFRVVLALTHAPQYQADHDEALAQDWAHVPVPGDLGLFRNIATAGSTVATLLDPGSQPDAAIQSALDPQVSRVIGVLRHRTRSAVRPEDLDVTVSYFGAAKGKWVARPPAEAEPLPPALGLRTGDLYLSDEVFLSHVPESVWTYELGGYPVLRKWLGYRHRDRIQRPLTLAETRHLRSIVQRLSALIVMGEQLDRLYEKAVAAALTGEQLGLRVV